MGEKRSVGEDFPHEMSRVWKLRDAYREIGPTGLFGLSQIEATLERATIAQSSGDVVAILKSYEELKKCQ